MRSIKPGRGPSMMGGVMSIFMGVFGLIWTSIAASSGGGFFILFGIMFIVIAGISAAYNFINATGKKRFSAYDITDEREEPDPLNERFGQMRNDDTMQDYPEQPFGSAPNQPQAGSGSQFCPYCGAKVQEGFEFCNKCGKKLP